MQNLIKSILFKSRKQIHMDKRSHSLHYYEIKLIKNISSSEQGRPSLQKKILKLSSGIK